MDMISHKTRSFATRILKRSVVTSEQTDDGRKNNPDVRDKDRGREREREVKRRVGGE